MTSPVLHLGAGPNGAGKSSFVTDVLQPTARLQFVNADQIAAERWPTDQARHAYEAAQSAEEERQRLLAAGESFIAETVFSHPSKVALVEEAIARQYLVHLHVLLIPVDLAVARVRDRVRRGGHDVPEQKIRERHDRLWWLVAEARATADRTDFYDNSRAASPFRLVATYERGRQVGEPTWPSWAPSVLPRTAPP